MLLQGFDGEQIWVNPNQRSPLYVPRLLFGFHRLKQLRRWEPGFQFHHFYNPDPFPFLYLCHLQRPVLYSITCGVSDISPHRPFFTRLAGLVVTDERSWRRLRNWGFERVYRVQAGIEVERFTVEPLPVGSEIKLMVGSAPWTKGQFWTKGIEALLAAAQQEPRLRLVFLWRGVLGDEIRQRVQAMKLEQQVELIDRQVDVNRVLAGVHASITLATRPGIVKSYPHSLLDSLAAGKPVLVSRAIPMADYVRDTNCGQVVEHVTAESVLTAIETLAQNYDMHQQVARLVGRRDFSQAAMLDSYRKVYEQVLETIHG